MEAEIRPEPTAEEGEALLKAIAELDELQKPPAVYRNPWRLSGLANGDDDEGSSRPPRGA